MMGIFVILKDGGRVFPFLLKYAQDVRRKGCMRTILLTHWERMECISVHSAKRKGLKSTFTALGRLKIREGPMNALLRNHQFNGLNFVG